MQNQVDRCKLCRCRLDPNGLCECGCTDLDDWEGPPAPEYPESDPEAYDEMVREDMEGKS